MNICLAFLGKNECGENYAADSVPALIIVILLLVRSGSLRKLALILIASEILAVARCSIVERGREMILPSHRIPGHQLTVTVNLVLAVVVEASFPLPRTVNV